MRIDSNLSTFILFDHDDDGIEASGEGTDAIQLAGSYADYQLILLADTAAGKTWRIQDSVAGRDGNDIVTNVEAVSFRDITNVELGSLVSPLPVKDVLGVTSTGAAITRTGGAFTILKSQILDNDIDWQGDVLSILAITDAQGGTATLSGGNVIFTPSAGYTGVMGFKYTVKDAAGNVANDSLWRKAA